MNNTIIHPTDFSKCSMVALEYSIHLAKVFNCELLIVHSFDFSKLDGFDEAAHSLIAKTKEIEEEAEMKLREIGNSIVQRGVKCGPALYNGPLKSWLPDMIISMKPKFVVMGTTGAGSLGNKFFGSNASAIMQTSTSPVIAVPVSSSFQALENIVLAADLEKVEIDVFQFIRDFTSTLGSQLQLAYVSSEAKKDHGKEVIEKVKSIFGKFDSPVDLEYNMILNDNYISGISQYVSQNKPDLLAIIMTNKNFIEKFLFGSLSDKMIHHSDLPLLVIPQS